MHIIKLLLLLSLLQTQLLSTTNPLGQTTTYEYDAIHMEFVGTVSSKGDLLVKREPNGTITRHTYDNDSNLLSTTITTIEGVTTTSSNTYDAFNRLVTSTDSRGDTSTNSYDMRGNKTSTTDLLVPIAPAWECIYRVIFNQHSLNNLNISMNSHAGAMGTRKRSFI